MKPRFLEKWRWLQAKKIMVKLHDLSYFFWETTLQCNLDCRHCGSDCSKDVKATELEGSKVIEVFSDIAKHYDAKKILVAVTGGEPLLRQDLFEVLSEVHKMGFSWGMVTNGMLVNESVVDHCQATGMRSVSVSLDGLEAAHNWLRKNEKSYERSINALKLFADKGDLWVVEAITCVNESNINELEGIYLLLKNLGVHKWRLISIIPKGRAQEHEELELTKDLLVRLFNFIKAKRQDDGLYVSYSEEGYLNCDWEKAVRKNYFYCGAGINVASLLCDGSFSACPSLSREWVQGHMDEISFPEAWEKRYGNMRDRHWLKSTDCSNCKEWKKCQGSSLHLWDWQNNKQKFCHYRMLEAKPMITDHIS